ncbi:hypothetical protein WICPIJ_003053 [Wickerhamomyces pijperi]|uniref:Uncharacterized protein n=1 Tax=Wickerhamomyces pijperi TaxID=599730 RepID=A0A9P8Q807_WICPI|nr:hypothetical protein WICPIJ_003053 [Wickerhamomyces pijperi]
MLKLMASTNPSTSPLTDGKTLNSLPCNADSTKYKARQNSGKSNSPDLFKSDNSQMTDNCWAAKPERNKISLAFEAGMV